VVTLVIDVNIKFGWKVNCAFWCRFMQHSVTELVILIVGSTDPLPVMIEIYG
jgi:hypothetical protein